MTPERWESTKQLIRDKFTIADEYIEDLEPGQAEVIEFTTPQGNFQVRFISRPKVVDKKTLYSNRPGANVRVDYAYSDDEVVCHLECNRWQESTQSWVKVNAEGMF